MCEHPFLYSLHLHHDVDIHRNMECRLKKSIHLLCGGGICIDFLLSKEIFYGKR